MNPESVYYLFSISAVLAVAVHVWNFASLKLNNKNLLGKTFKKGTPEYQDMQKSIGKKYATIITVAFIVLLSNLVFAVRDVLRSFNGGKATAVLLIYAFMALVIVVGALIVLRNYSRESTDHHAMTKHDDDDW